MLLEAGKIVICVLWLLLCLRVYTMISKENGWQRRLIAIGAGLGAGLIYVLGTMLISVLKASSQEEPVPVEQSQDVRVKMK